MTETIAGRVAQVAKIRADLRALDDERRAREKSFKTKNATLFEQITQAQSELSDSEQELRDLTIQAFNETGDKHPHPAVGIRETKALQYDTGLALQYAKVNLPDALTLDIKIFSKVMKALDPAGRPPFVSESVTPQATISQDLSEYLPEDPEAVAAFEELRLQPLIQRVIPISPELAEEIEAGGKAVDQFIRGELRKAVEAVDTAITGALETNPEMQKAVEGLYGDDDCPF